MFVDQQLAQLNNPGCNPAPLPLWNTRVFDDDVRHVCDACFGQRQIRKLFGQGACESSWWSVNCCVTGVQANTGRTHKEGNARNVLMLGIQTTLLLTQIGRVA